MENLQNYKKQDMFAGWTRIDMLLRIYDNAIESLTSSERFHSEENVLEYTKSVAASQKAVLAIHAGLKPDEHDVAFNVARLLHFVLQKIESNEFKDAIMVLENLRSGFTQIEEEARILELSGHIPPIQNSETFERNA